MPEQKFTFRTEIPLRWSDVDEFHMVNNARYLTFLEEARAHWMQKMEWDLAAFGVVVVNTNINFRTPMRYPADTPSVMMRVDEIGSTSFRLMNLIAKMQNDTAQKVFADASVTMVVFDMKTGQPIEIPEGLKNKLRLFESPGT